MKIAVAKALFKSHDYQEYRKLIADLLLQEKSTGNQQSETLTNNSGLNETRMNHLDKTVEITDENIEKLKSLKRRYIWLVLAEGWCADSAQVLPILNKLAQESDNIDLKIVLADENEDLMDLFLTDGVRAIPKLIVVDKESSAIFGSWGPVPKGINDLINNHNENNFAIGEISKTELHMWYLHDKGFSIQDELVSLALDLEHQHKEID